MRTAHHRRAAPAWTRRSLSTAGRRHSGSLGIASYYSQPQRVASGGWFDPNAMTAAHRTLPFGSRVRVTHMRNGRSVEVVIHHANGSSYTILTTQTMSDEHIAWFRAGSALNVLRGG